MSDTAIERRIAEATELFEKNVGTWDAEMEIRPTPDAPVIRQRGASNNRRIGGGRWLVIDVTTESGFEGHGVYGWDARKEAYVGVWVDSMQSAIALSEGAWDPANKTMTYVTETSHEGRTVRYRETVQYLEDGTLLYRNLVPAPGGGDFEMIRTVYRRR